MPRIFKPPLALPRPNYRLSVFLAGSIEMGQAEDWQSSVISALIDLEVDILNPRRDEWDASWVQSIHNPQFREQVEWELAAQEQASLIAMYFAPATKAPITLLEFGLFARSGKLIVCCPDGYWRKGNLEVACARYRIPLTARFDEFVAAIRHRLGAG